jgi:transposase InsO family protein
MRENGLKGRVVRVTRRQPGLHRFCEGLPNRLKDAGNPTAPDQQWAGDITYLPVAGKWRYLAVIIDLYSRRIVSWALSDRRTIELTYQAMRAAIKRRKPGAGLVFHTDRGIEYRSLVFRGLLAAHHIIASMNRPGQTTDNAYAESFFHTLKAEFFRGRCFNTIQELRRGLAGYINHFYNRQRMHSGLGYCSPEEYERIAA